MSEIIDITRFSGVDDIRFYLNAPWRRNGFLYATNGHFMIEIPDDGREAAEYSKHPDCAALFVKNVPGEFGPLPRLSPMTVCTICKGKGSYREVDCDDCDGAGEFDHGHHTYECLNCDGNGTIGNSNEDTRCGACYGLGEEVNRGDSTNVGENKYATRLLRPISKLPGVTVATCGKDAALYFKFDGGRGLVMPMRV